MRVRRCVAVIAAALIGAGFLFCCSNFAVEPPAELPGDIRLVLPPRIDAVVGVEANVYFDNVVLVLNPANYAFDVECAKGRQQEERWTFTPQPGDVGEHLFELKVRNERNEVVARGGSVLRVVAADAGDGKEISLLLIGDSLTHASTYPQRLLELCQKPGNPRLALVGSHAPDDAAGEVRHEGYGGWSAQTFATYYRETARQGDYRQRGSPFLYLGADGAPALDFTAYCRDVHDGRPPDVVTIFLGPNDIFSFDDAGIDEGIRIMQEHYDTLIRMVHAASSQTRIGVMLPVPPAATQDAFGASYATGQTRWQYKRNQHRLVERMIARYGARQDERIELVATHVNLDSERNYPVEVATFNGATDVLGPRQSNGAHPAKSGYYQIADSLYAWLKGQF